MNDIGIKIVESPKDRLLGADVSPTPEVENENEVDPLSIDDDVKDPLVVVDVKTECEDNCDDNAKEELVSETQNKDSDTLQASETVKGTIYLIYQYFHSMSLSLIDFPITA